MTNIRGKYGIKPNKRRKKRAADYIARGRESYDRWRKKDPLAYLLTAAKNRARMRGTDFSITKDDLFIPEKCPVLGVTLDTDWAEIGSGRIGNRRWYRPSIDRINPKLGYVPGNVRIISWRANAIKYDATATEMRLVANDLEKLEKSCG